MDEIVDELLPTYIYWGYVYNLPKNEPFLRQMNSGKWPDGQSGHPF